MTAPPLLPPSFTASRSNAKNRPTTSVRSNRDRDVPAVGSECVLEDLVYVNDYFPFFSDNLYVQYAKSRPTSLYAVPVMVFAVYDIAFNVTHLNFAHVEDDGPFFAAALALWITSIAAFLTSCAARLVLSGTVLTLPRWLAPTAVAPAAATADRDKSNGAAKGSNKSKQSSAKNGGTGGAGADAGAGAGAEIAAGNVEAGRGPGTGPVSGSQVGQGWGPHLRRWAREALSPSWLGATLDDWVGALRVISFSLLLLARVGRCVVLLITHCGFNNDRPTDQLTTTPTIPSHQYFS